MSVVRPPDYWNRHFYWDHAIDLSRFRTAQRMEAYERMLHFGSWFIRDRSEISGYLYLLAWVVATGKTLGIPAVAFGYNAFIGGQQSGRPRADRILILTKDRAVRDQIAFELAIDLVRYEICLAHPSVSILGHFKPEEFASLVNAYVLPHQRKLVKVRRIAFDALDLQTLLGQADIVVGCAQQFWTANGQSKPGTPEKLALFPLIFYDEAHFGNNQVMALVEQSRESISFALTGSPIEADGSVSRRYVLLSQYTYVQAAEYDGSVKFLSTDRDAINSIIREIKVNTATIQTGSDIYTVSGTKVDDYPINLQAPMSVARAVVEELKELDAYCDHPQDFTAAPHRPSSPHCAGHVPHDLIYPAHGLIVAEDIETARKLGDDLNSIFESDTFAYPPSQGWRAEVVHSDTDESEASPLKPDHPWFTAKREQPVRRNGQWVMPHKATWSRLLIVVGMGREGVNNPYCCVVGVTKKCDVLREWIQRMIGRPLRAVVEVIDGRPVRYPPVRLDRLRLIIHEAHAGNRPMAERAITWMIEMADHLDEITSLESLMNGLGSTVQTGQPVDTGESLRQPERIAIASAVGRAIATGQPVNPVTVIESVIPRRDLTDAKRRKATEWVDVVVNDPETARQQIHIVDGLQALNVVRSESIEHNPTIPHLSAFVRHHRPANLHGLIHELVTNAPLREFVTAEYVSHHQRLHSIPLRRDTSLQEVKNRIAGIVFTQIGKSLTADKNVVFRLVGRAVKSLFGCQDGETVSDGSPFDTPQHHYILRRPDVRYQIVGWVIRKLIALGHLPNLAAALRLPQEEVDGEA